MMTITVDEPTRSVRTSPGLDPSRRLVIVGGEGHVTGRRGDTNGAIANLVQWADDQMGVAEVVHHWSAQDYQATDGLPFVGALWPLDGRCLMATGYGKWGFTNGSAAALVLADLIDGAKAPDWAEIYDPTRWGGVYSIRRTVEVNAGVAKLFAIDWTGATRRRPSSAVRTVEGQGCVIRDGVKQIAESCVGGRVRRVSAVCPHLGGVVRWNQLEQSWDCPLHGSRFDPDGRLLEGTTTSDLESFDEGVGAGTD
jgi:Rieske Fe-S protein